MKNKYTKKEIKLFQSAIEIYEYCEDHDGCDDCIFNDKNIHNEDYCILLCPIDGWEVK